jgi:hypothetical protein
MKCPLCIGLCVLFDLLAVAPSVNAEVINVTATRGRKGVRNHYWRKRRSFVECRHGTSIKIGCWRVCVPCAQPRERPDADI